MAKTYEPETLALGSPNQIEWGLAWYRFLSGDKPSDITANEVYPQYSLTDEEIEGLLTITSVVFDGSSYYVPHEALVMKIMTDPTYAVQVSEESYSQTFVSPHKLAENIRGLAQRHLEKLYPGDVVFGFINIGMTPGF